MHSHSLVYVYPSSNVLLSLGCLLYEMASLKRPFEAENLKALVAKVYVGKYSPIPSGYSRDLSDMVKALLCCVIYILCSLSLFFCSLIDYAQLWIHLNDQPSMISLTVRLCNNDCDWFDVTSWTQLQAHQVVVCQMMHVFAPLSKYHETSAISLQCCQLSDGSQHHDGTSC